MAGPSNFAQAGAAFGVFLKSKDSKIREASLSAAVTGIFSITETAIYGVTLRYKKPFYIACLSGTVAGAIGGASNNSTALAAGLVDILSIPVFMGEGFTDFLIAISVAFFMSAILTYLFLYNDKINETLSKEKVLDSNTNAEKDLTDVVINAPVKGEAVALSQVKVVERNLSIGIKK